MSLLCSVRHIFTTDKRIFSSIQLLVNQKFFHQSSFKLIKTFFVSPASIYATLFIKVRGRNPGGGKVLNSTDDIVMMRICSNKLLLDVLQTLSTVGANTNAHSYISCAGRCTLRSSVHGNLVVPFARSATMQTRSFSVVGPTTWNVLPMDLRYLANGACSQFHHLPMTVLFRLAWVGSASE